MKHLLTPGLIFEELGFRYIGPVEGHDLDALVDTLTRVRNLAGPILVHVITRKGKGFHLAEADPWTWHAASPFDKLTGHGKKKVSAVPALPRYQKAFGTALTELATEDPRVVAITAAMPDGTSTDIFSRAHPERYFDVGIAEAHGVTFAAGLATEGIRPVVAIYSTFLQRAYDSIVHDVALQDLPVVFCMDRAGIAGEDGPTHHGAFDICYMLCVPGMTVTAPKDGIEMLALMRSALAHDRGPFSIRYPRDAVPAEVPPIAQIQPIPYGSWELLRKGQKVAILATGTMVLPALAAATTLAADSIDATVVNCRFLKPYDRPLLEELVRTHSALVTVEEGALMNGFGACMAREIDALAGARAVRVDAMGIPDRFIEHGGRDELLRELGLDAAGIAARVRALAETVPLRRVARESA
jgi:1-deoxy-D-xylulose-5-phosphate synthase